MNRLISVLRYISISFLAKLWKHFFARDPLPTKSGQLSNAEDSKKYFFGFLLHSLWVVFIIYISIINIK